jgi:hypothetical protein
MAIQVNKNKQRSASVNSSNTGSNTSNSSVSAARRRLKEERQRDVYRVPRDWTMPVSAPSYAPAPVQIPSHSTTEEAHRRHKMHAQEQKQHLHRVLLVTALFIGFAGIAVAYIAPTVIYSRVLQQTEATEKYSNRLDREKSHLMHDAKNLEHLAKKSAKTSLNMRETPTESIKQILIK